MRDDPMSSAPPPAEPGKSAASGKTPALAASPTIGHVERDGGGAFVVERDGRRLAEMTYALDTPGVMVIDHTEVSPELRGEGVAMRLLEAAVQRARSASMRIEPTCSYARAALRREPRFADVLRD